MDVCDICDDGIDGMMRNVMTDDSPKVPYSKSPKIILLIPALRGLCEKFYFG